MRIIKLLLFFPQLLIRPYQINLFTILRKDWFRLMDVLMLRGRRRLLIVTKLQRRVSRKTICKQ